MLLAVSSSGCPDETVSSQPELGFPKPDKSVADLSDDVPQGDTAETEPRVEILGLVGLEEHGDLFCPNEQTVIIGARNIGDRPLRLIINDFLLLDAEPVPDSAPDRFLVTADFSVLLTPDVGLTDGAQLTLTAAALEDGNIPLDERYKHTRTFTLDAVAPQLTVTEPDTAECPVTLIGQVGIGGKVTDNRQVGRVEVRFAGDTMGSFPRAEGETTSQSFNTEVDLRLAPSALEPFEIVAYDACGQSTAWACDAKVVRWAWLREHPSYPLPNEPFINDVDLLDWDGDGYTDALFATNKGVMLALNGGEDAPGTFHEKIVLTSKAADLVASVDLDEDGELDIVTVERVNGPLSLVVYRHLLDGSLSPEEVRPLGLANQAKVVDMVVADFTGDPAESKRDDVIIASDSQQQTLILFKRQNADNPTAADQCHEVVVEADPGPGGDADADAGSADVAQQTQIVCPALFAEPSFAGPVDKVTQIAAYDLPGPDGPDGYLDLVLGADAKSAVYAFPNRFSQTASLDTSFTISTVSFAWPDPQTSTRPRHFCLGNFIQTGEVNDPVDMVVGLEGEGNWRVLRGVSSEVGKFLVNKENAEDPHDVLSMSGSTGTDIGGMVCGDFNADGYDDFIVISRASRLMQVHLGDGMGRFNQLPASNLLNPVNEGIGFVVHRDAAKPQVADLDNDGLLDLLVSQRGNGFGVYLNRTTSERGFDFDAMRALVTPLANKSTTGRLQRMALGDLNGDGKPEVVAMSKASTKGNEKWIDLFHPLAKQYRMWFGSPEKNAIAPVVYVWRNGQYGADMPSFPAAYDTLPSKLYDEPFYGAVDPLAIQVVDLAGPNGMQPDGFADLVVSGAPADSIETSFNLLINNATDGDFWDVSKLTEPKGAMFRPWSGYEKGSEPIYDFALIPDPGGGIVPALAVGMKRHAQWEPECVQPTLRVCPWDFNKPVPGFDGVTAPYWRCPIYYGLSDDCPNVALPTLDKLIGGQVRDIERIAVSGPLAGSPTQDPNVDSDLILVNQATNSITYFRFDPSKGAHPFATGKEKGIGSAPKDIAIGDVSGDGLVDMVTSVQDFVFMAFGRTGDDPFDAPVNIDVGGEKQKGPENVVLSDLNADGLLDVIWTEKGNGRVASYLNIGPDPKDAGRWRFKGPFYQDVCDQPTEIVTYDFDGDGCDEVLVLCERAGAIAVVANDTCTKLAQ